jgi:hypothetical protein
MKVPEIGEFGLIARLEKKDEGFGIEILSLRSLYGRDTKSYAEYGP